MRKIIFIRHGATKGNLEKRYIGRTDEPLCETGIVQMQQLRQQNFQIDRLFITPALRTRQSAEILFPDGHPCVIDDLRETNFGRFEGKTAAELQDDAVYQAWVDSTCLSPIPNGERIEGFKTRCSAAFLSVAARLPDNSTTAFVIHGGSIMSILEACAVPKKDFYAYHIPNGSFISCQYQDGLLYPMEWK